MPDNKFGIVNRSQIISRIAARQPNLTPQDVKAGIEVLLDFMGESFRQGKRVEIRKFGSFSMRKHKQKMTHNLKTSETVLVPERYTPHFKPSTTLKESLNPSHRLSDTSSQPVDPLDDYFDD